MISKISHIFTELSPDEAMAIITVLDQLRAALLVSYGEDIHYVLQQRSAEFESSYPPYPEEEPF